MFKMKFFIFTMLSLTQQCNCAWYMYLNQIAARSRPLQEFARFCYHYAKVIQSALFFFLRTDYCPVSMIKLFRSDFQVWELFYELCQLTRSKYVIVSLKDNVLFVLFRYFWRLRYHRLDFLFCFVFSLFQNLFYIFFFHIPGNQHILLAESLVFLFHCPDVDQQFSSGFEDSYEL